jgi:chromosome segregation ATPase
MVEAQQEFIHELLRRFHQRVDNTDAATLNLRNQVNSLRLELHANQGDINNLYSLINQIDERLERVEKRLDLREFEEAQARFEPHP